MLGKPCLYPQQKSSLRMDNSLISSSPHTDEVQYLWLGLLRFMVFIVLPATTAKPAPEDNSRPDPRLSPSQHLRAQYATRHPLSPEPTVRTNDLIFGLHGFVLSAITYSQFWPQLWGWKRLAGVQRQASRTTLGLISGSLLALLIICIMVLANHDNGNNWKWIDVVLSNIHRKSTTGWSISQVLLDFIGGILSLAQLVIDSALQADWSGLLGNPVKLGLANTSLLFDIIFMTQHYILYGDVGKVVQQEDDVSGDPVNSSRRETDPLLHPSNDGR
nr:cystinosin like [Quercus suber]